MNNVVKYVIRPPYEEDGKWVVPVMYTTGDHARLTFDTKEEAEAIRLGSQL